MQLLRAAGVLDELNARVTDKQGPDHDPVFSAVVRVMTATGLAIQATGRHRTARGAKHLAAAGAWDQLLLAERPGAIAAAAAAGSVPLR